MPGVSYSCVRWGTHAITLDYALWQERERETETDQARARAEHEVRTRVRKPTIVGRARIALREGNWEKARLGGSGRRRSPGKKEVKGGQVKGKFL